MKFWRKELVGRGGQSKQGEKKMAGSGSTDEHISGKRKGAYEELALPQGILLLPGLLLLLPERDIGALSDTAHLPCPR